MSLIKFLQENENTRKVFGKRELKIIEKQLFGINLTQSEKNRLSRDIRKKFEFIEKVARFSDEFKFKKGTKIKELIEDVKKEILAHHLRKEIEKIMLYGSSVNNQRTFRSDIDIAVIFKKINLKQATMFRIKISGRVSDLVDIQVFNVLPEKIKKEILSKGKVLWEE
ncbi:MAG: nucleotidyltransferase domain-containing protein [Candidatus Woesearchaeota archaeon]